ncbi:MAG: insulinase family protein, partial [Desulfovibrio sp.]|nr:insulinase family protein [Desulfovibrio sp.]
AEKDVILSELQAGEDNPAHKLFEDLQTATLQHSVYGHPIIGYEPTIRAVRAEDLRAYRDTWYQPQNMGLLVVGDIEPEYVYAYVKQLFGGLKNTDPLKMVEPIDLQKCMAEKQVDVRYGPWKKVYLGLAFPAPALSDLSSIDLDVLCYLLTGDETAKFNKSYRYDTQLVDSIDVSNMNLARGGMLSIDVVLDAKNVARFWPALLKDLGGLSAAEFSKESVERAVFNIEMAMDRASETLTGLARWKSTVLFSLGGSFGEKNLRARLKNISPETLDAAIAKWFDPKKAIVRVLAPTGTTLPDLAGQLKWGNGQKQEEKIAEYVTQSEIIALENGCSLRLLPDTHAPYLSLAMIRSGGNSLLTANEQGLAQLTANLLSDGAGSFDAQALERYLTSRGMSLQCAAGKQVFSLQMDGPSKYQQDLLSILDLIINEPRFTEQDFLREKHVQTQALLARQDQPLSYLFAKLGPMLYANHPYGFDNLGTEETLKSLSLQNVRDFWQAQRSEPWVLTVAGSFQKDSVLAVAQKLAKESGAKKVVLQKPILGQEKKLLINLPGRNQAHLLKIFPTVPFTHSDAPALLLLSSVLSGQSGLLFCSMRDVEGLGYTVTAFPRLLP